MVKKQMKDYPRLSNIRRIRGLSEENARCLEEWVYRERNDGLKLSSIDLDVYKMVQWIRDFGGGDIRAVTPVDIMRAYSVRMDRVAAGEYSDATLDVDVIVLRKFFKWLYGPEEGSRYVDIKRKKHPNTRTLDEYITREQVMMMRNYAESRGDVRGVALIMLTYGTGARRGEIHAANVRDVKIYRTHATIRLDGKTGVRQSPFVVSLPEIQNWINAHPCRLPDGTVDPDAPLFVTYNTRGHGNVRLSPGRITAYIRGVATAVGVPPDIKASPHALRHLSASENARNFTSAEMERYYGWSRGSQTPATYVHSSDESLKDTILRNNGVVEQEMVSDTAMVTQCPRCKTINAVGARYCSACSLALDENLAKLYNEIVQDLNDSDIIKAVVDAKVNHANNSQYE